MNTEKLQAKLDDQKKRLENELGGVGRRNEVVPNDWEASTPNVEMEADPIDQADMLADQENNVAILTSLEEQYDRVLAALDRLKKGTYGTCSVCAKQIEEARLEADPTATSCIEHR